MTKRALVCYCVDVDCCAAWLCSGSGKPGNSTGVSRGLFGANVGLERLLKFFDRHGIKGTFNIPSHTIESFPNQVAPIRDAGHEIGLHGYMHEPPHDLTEEQERVVLQKSIDVYKQFTGKHPQGFIAPCWEASSRTIRLLEEHGLSYDHSLMAHDSQPYMAADVAVDEAWVDYSKPAESWMKPMKSLNKTNIVEIPGNWDCTDFAAMNFVPGQPNGYVDPYLIERNWKDMFTWLYHEYNSSTNPQGFVFPLTIHPQSSGKPHILAMHDRFVKWLKEEWEGVEFVTCAQVADEYRAGILKGAEVHGGVLVS